MSQTWLAEARFSGKVRNYNVFNTVLVCVLTLVGIPFLLVLVPLVWWITGRQLDHMSARMDERFLKVERGIWTKTEKNVPLEQITDMGIIEGPVMRFFGLKQLSVETAGQSAGPLVRLLGVEDTEAFRDRVLAQRDLLRKQMGSGSSETNQAVAAVDTDGVAMETLATLKRIESLLERQTDERGRG